MLKRKENRMWLAHRKQNSKEIMNQNIFTILFLNKKGSFFYFSETVFSGTVLRDRLGFCCVDMDGYRYMYGGLVCKC
jgi:hypothetical protein